MIDSFLASVILPIVSLLKTVWSYVRNSIRNSVNSIFKAPYQLVVWDFGDTLDRLREAALAEGAAAIERELGCHVNAEMLRAAIRKEWSKRSDQSSLNIIRAIDTVEKEGDYYREFYHCIISTFSNKLPSRALLDNLVHMQVAPQSYELMPGAKDVLDKLKEKGIRQAILSNGFVSTREHIKHLDIEDYFERIMVSYEERAAKPDTALYQRLLKFCEINRPQETLFIDDRIEFIKGAAHMKMNTLWFQPQDSSENVYPVERISSLSQVFDKVVEKEQEYDWFFRSYRSTPQKAYS